MPYYSKRAYEHTAAIVSGIVDEHTRKSVTREFSALYEHDNERFRADQFARACEDAKGNVPVQ